MKNISFLLLTLFLLPVITRAQSALQNILPNISPASPDQAAFAKFGNYEVNLLHGLPDINIPLYKVKSGSLTLPVSISYHASGIKVNDWGSWVGIGWSLNAGAGITRKIMGLPDEEPHNYLSGETPVPDATAISTTDQDDLTLLWYVNEKYKDCEPDIFYYNLPGKSGKFLFNQLDNFIPIIIPFDPIKINMVSPQDFKITDDNGILYDFHDLETTDITTNSTSAWLLSQMSSANNQDQINFSYNSRWGATGADYQDYVVDDQYTNDNDPTGPFHYTSTYTTYPATSNIGIAGTEQKISEITFTNGKLVFVPSADDREDGFTGQKALDHIEIYSKDPADGTYSLIKLILFHQSYFTGGTSGLDWYDKRLKLDSIEITDGNSNVIEKYRFDYNTDITMPDRLSRQKDFWGYYNGKSNNTLVPRQTVPFNDGLTSTTHVIGSGVPDGRNPDPDYMQACMLKRIYYPTGGYTDFEFETNKYKDDNDDVKYAGGLRIRSIKSYDGINSEPLVKTYKYGVGEDGCGRANFFDPLQYLAISQGYRYLNYLHNIHGDEIPGCIFPVSTKVSITYYATPTIEIEPYDGAPVVYGTVTEYTGDETANTGKTVYEFTDQPDNIDNPPTLMCYRPIVTSYHMDRGQLKHKWVYKRNADGAYFLLAETENTYEDFSEQWFYKLGFVVFKNLISQGPYDSDDIFIGTDNICVSDEYSYNYVNYDIRTTSNRLVENTETVYDPNGISEPIITTTGYDYDNLTYLQPTKITTANSKQETITSERKYPPDFDAEPYLTMTGLNILDKIVQEKKSKNTDQVSLMNNNYADQNNNNYLPYTIDYQLGSHDMETRASFNNYDAKGNILEMQKANDIKTSFQWGYDQMYVVAQVQNASNNLQQTTEYTPVTGSSGFTVFGPGTQNLTKTITVTDEGDVSIKMGYTGGSADISGNYSGDLGSDNYSFTSSAACGDNTIVTFPDVSPGIYSITITFSCSNCGGGTFGVCGSIEYPSTVATVSTTGSKEFFYEGFEEQDYASTDNPCAGKRYYEGDYTVPYTIPDDRDYILQYHYRDGSLWHAVTEPYEDNMTLTDGDGIDEVRVFPKDAQMTTYTYQPLIGVTSRCDINNRITYYEYDGMGRLRLIRDQDKNILKKICYNYAGQEVNCDEIP